MLAAALIAVALFLPVLIWNGRNMTGRIVQVLQLVQQASATPRHIASHPSAISSACSSAWAFIGFVLLPVVAFGLVLTAWRGHRRGGDAVAILLSTSVIVPFVYFFWKSLELAGRRHLADVHVADRVLPPPRSTSRCCRARGFQPRRSGRASGVWPMPRSLCPASALSCWCFCITSQHPGIFIGKNDPIGGEAGLARRWWNGRRPNCKPSARAGSRLRDYRTVNSMLLRWYFAGRVPGDPDQRARPLSRLSAIRT